ncbi:type II toxin-antitoxin system prevent-host-death family antitoxin [soil metagenome]
MQSVGSYDAKTHLSELLDRVARGETILITRYGTPVAKLAPAGPASDRNPGEVFQEILEFRKGRRLTAAEARELVKEGRKT